MNILKDVYYTNRFVFKKTIALFSKNFVIVFSGFIYFFAQLILNEIMTTSNLSILGIIGSIIMFIVNGALLSNFLYLLFVVINKGKVTIEDFKDGFKPFFRKAITIIVIGNISGYIFFNLMKPFMSNYQGGFWISILIELLLVILLNPLREAIYLKDYEPWDTIVYSFKFIKENWIEWFIPNIIFSLGFLLTVSFGLGKLFLLSTNILEYIFTIFMRDASILNINYNFLLSFSIKYIIINIIGQIIFSFMMIYRGLLFNELSTSTRRKRMFKRNMYD